MPNEFVSGTRARAADVNENFAALASEINDNDQRIAELEARSPGSLTPLTVVQQDAEIGDVVMLGDEMVTISGFDFIRFSDDTLYTAEIPTTTTFLSASYCDAPSCLGGVNSEFGFSFQLNGFDATLEQRYSQDTRSFGVAVLPFDTIANTVRVQVGPQTVLSIIYMYTPDNFPIAGVVPPLDRADREAVLQLALDRLPYIEIRPASP